MALPRLSNLEMQIMEILWRRGPCSVRQILEELPAKRRPAYTTVKTMVVRLEAKKALRRTGKEQAAYIYEARIAQEAARRRLLDTILAIFGGEPKPIMMHLVRASKLSLDDIQEVETFLRQTAKKERKP